ncbi:MAG: tagaturonate reductase [Bacillota bacterium]|nr:tagaturonate reductase [Bacillota bacterium]
MNRANAIKILQFGEGRFLRAFMEDMLQQVNEEAGYRGSVCIVKPRDGGSLDAFARQGNVYTLLLRGKKNGETVETSRRIDSIRSVYYGSGDYRKYMSLAESDELKLVVSNTTEAGIRFDPEDRSPQDPPATYPGKLTAFLYRRFQTFAKAKEADQSGLVILPLELNENNADLLQATIVRYAEHWGLEREFLSWLEEANLFCNTLVDRIVTGSADSLTVTAEPYGSLVIETDRADDVLRAFPFDRCGLEVTFTEDITPYRQQKVRLLNGIHTSICLTGLMMGLKHVDECMSHPLMRRYINMLISEEIMPTIPLSQETVKAFADSVIERFENPFLHHRLQDIALNSVSKWKTRILPTVMDYRKMRGRLPEGLMFSLAALLVYYDGGWKQCGIDRLGDSDNAAEILASCGELEVCAKKLVSDIKGCGVEKTLETITAEGEGNADQDHS